MFEFGFSKLIIISAVALVVIGPKQLPTVARSIGHMWGRMARYIADAKNQMNQAFLIDEIKQLESEVKTSFHQAQAAINQQLESIEQTVQTEVTQLDTQLNSTLTIGNDSAATPNSADSAASDEASATIYSYQPQLVKRNWRLKQPSVPLWYKKQLHCRQPHRLAKSSSKLRRKLSHKN